VPKDGSRWKKSSHAETTGSWIDAARRRVGLGLDPRVVQRLRTTRGPGRSLGGRTKLDWGRGRDAVLLVSFSAQRSQQSFHRLSVDGFDEVVIESGV
jgi:hypothetical protein